jgi:hypothetical protein
MNNLKKIFNLEFLINNYKINFKRGTFYIIMLINIFLNYNI